MLAREISRAYRELSRRFPIPMLAVRTATKNNYYVQEFAFNSYQTWGRC